MILKDSITTNTVDFLFDIFDIHYDFFRTTKCTKEILSVSCFYFHYGIVHFKPFVSVLCPKRLTQQNDSNTNQSYINII